MKIKVCGMSEPQNIIEVANLAPDYMGFIFYEKSPRFVKDESAIELLESYPKIQKVGVFVNASLEYIEQKSKKHHFSFLQLHGKESVDFCRKIKQTINSKIIKAFGVDENFDFLQVAEYQKVADYLLFDTKTAHYGGSGRKFSWDILKNYNNKIPIFLSGGLNLQNIDLATKIPFLNIHALDLNSQFEKKPAQKDINLLKQVHFQKYR
jgi:phosphoribosylanthranilate isomerase